MIDCIVSDELNYEKDPMKRERSTSFINLYLEPQAWIRLAIVEGGSLLT